MTSRDGSPRKLEDAWDRMIRGALRERAACAAPPAGVWKRINARLSRRTDLSRAAWWRRVRRAGRAVAFGILEVALSPAPQFVYVYVPPPRSLWEGGYACTFIRRGGLPALPGPV